MKNKSILLSIIFAGFIVLFILNLKSMFFGRFLYSQFNICLQNPVNSFPCFGLYDLVFDILMTLSASISLIFLVVNLLKLKNK
jgi:hypothetical protein